MRMLTPSVTSYLRHDNISILLKKGRKRATPNFKKLRFESTYEACKLKTTGSVMFYSRFP